MAKTVYKVNDPEIKFWVKNNIRFDAKPDGNGLYLRFRQNDRYPAFSFVLNSLVLRIKSCWVSYPRLSLAAARSLSDNRYKCLIFCGAIMQKKQDWACKTTSQITHS